MKGKWRLLLMILTLNIMLKVVVGDPPYSDGDCIDADVFDVTVITDVSNLLNYNLGFDISIDAYLVCHHYCMYDFEF
jgi:hypothetical protein